MDAREGRGARRPRRASSEAAAAGGAREGRVALVPRARAAVRGVGVVGQPSVRGRGDRRSRRGFPRVPGRGGLVFAHRLWCGIRATSHGRLRRRHVARHAHHRERPGPDLPPLAALLVGDVRLLGVHGGHDGRMVLRGEAVGAIHVWLGAGPSPLSGLGPRPAHAPPGRRVGPGPRLLRKPSGAGQAEHDPRQGAREAARDGSGGGGGGGFRGFQRRFPSPGGGGVSRGRAACAAAAAGRCRAGDAGDAASGGGARGGSIVLPVRTHRLRSTSLRVARDPFSWHQK
mmetsp:Transcript_2216/g.9414  ORF Transcript_2216/g.9414 Transcript_2216/m.9414 type:complete len:286 (-) Transcript_2216:13-870(-)